MTELVIQGTQSATYIGQGKVALAPINDRRSCRILALAESLHMNAPDETAADMVCGKAHTWIHRGEDGV